MVLIPLPTYNFFPIPIPPTTIAAPVIDDDASTVELTCNMSLAVNPLLMVKSAEAIYFPYIIFKLLTTRTEIVSPVNACAKILTLFNPSISQVNVANIFAPVLISPYSAIYAVVPL